MARCIGILRAAVVLWSLLLLILGVSLSAGAVYLYWRQDILYPYLATFREVVFDVRIAVVVVGALTVVTGTVALIGICTANQHLIQVHCYALVLGIMMQCGFAVFLYINKENLVTIAEYECLTLLGEAPSRPLISDFFSSLAREIGCCGCRDPTDYLLFKVAGGIPDRCYTLENSGEMVLHNTGCLPDLYQRVEDKSGWIAALNCSLTFLLLSIIVLTNFYLIHQHSPLRKTGRVTPSPSLNQINIVSTPIPTNNCVSTPIPTNNWVNVKGAPKSGGSPYLGPGTPNPSPRILREGSRARNMPKLTPTTMVIPSPRLSRNIVVRPSQVELRGIGTVVPNSAVVMLEDAF